MGVNGCNIKLLLRSDSLQITPEILSLIARIDEFKGAWRVLGAYSIGLGHSFQQHLDSDSRSTWTPIQPTLGHSFQ